MRLVIIKFKIKLMNKIVFLVMLKMFYFIEFYKILLFKLFWFKLVGKFFVFFFSLFW